MSIGLALKGGSYSRMPLTGLSPEPSYGLDLSRRLTDPSIASVMGIWVAPEIPNDPLANVIDW